MFLKKKAWEEMNLPSILNDTSPLILNIVYSGTLNIYYFLAV